MVRYGIIGGGWAGLLSAFEIRRRDSHAEIEILEKSSSGNLGGLLRTETIDGFTYDIGGPHILFSKNKTTLELLLNILGDNWKQMERKNFIHFEGNLIPYPFENGIYMMPAEDRAKIGLGIIENLFKLKMDKGWIPNSFYDWIYGIFGSEMGTRYLEPYNRKIWKRDLKDFDASWVFTPGRLPLPELRDIVFSVSGLPTVGYKEQAYFYYPKIGGIQSLYNALLEKVKAEGSILIPDFAAIKLERKGTGKWVLNGKKEFDRIISTLPLEELLRIMDAPTGMIEFASKLTHNRVIVIGFALNQPAPDRIALYVPQDDVVFHRYTWMSNLVSGPPVGKSNLIVEVTVPQDKPFDLPKLIEMAAEGLLKIGIIKDKSVIIHSRAWVHEYGYPVYMKGHNEIRASIMEYLDSMGIKSVGRWGSWHYWNTDKVIEAVRTLFES